MRSFAFMVPFVLACHNDVHDSASASGDDGSSSANDDSATVPTDDSSDDDKNCEKLEITYDGTPQPHVGDQWALQLWCDGALMTVTVIRFDPNDFASVATGNVATFLQPGDGTISMQAGTQREYLDVTVWE